VSSHYRTGDRELRDGSAIAPTASPAAIHFPQPAPVALPGARYRTDGAGGLHRRGPRSAVDASASPDFDPRAAVTRATQIAVANAAAFVAAKRSATSADLYDTPQLKPPQLTPSRLGAVRNLDRRTGPNRLATERTHAS
jgi:hypothetical protein